jgi:hypothetical protein
MVKVGAKVKGDKYLGMKGVTDSQIMLVSNMETGQNYSSFGVLLFLGILKK